MNHSNQPSSLALAAVAARLERLPVSSFHRRFISLISLGGWFDFFDIFMMAYLGAALQQSGFMTREEFGLTLAAGFIGHHDCIWRFNHHQVAHTHQGNQSAGGLHQ